MMLGVRIFKSTLHTVLVLVGASLLVLGILRLVPGDPIDHLLGDQAPDHARMILAKDLGLVDTEGKALGFISQYLGFVRDLSTGQLRSFRTREPVSQLIAGRLGHTIRLALLSLLFSLAIGPLFGILGAFRKNKLADKILQGWSVLFISIPRFALAPILILFFSLSYEWFPVSGVDEGLWSLVLPSLSLGLAMSAIQSRILRASILETLNEDYIRTARAKGCTTFQIYFRQALPNALLPLITVVGLEAGALLTGAVIIEKIFNLPGIGLLLLESIQTIDFPVVQALVLLISLIYIITNLLTELAYALVDPRIREENQ